MAEEKRIQHYENAQIEVGFNPNICAHSAKCIKGLPSVFNLKGRPWVNVDGDTAEAIANLIKTCPSGALTYKLKNTDGRSEE